ERASSRRKKLAHRRAHDADGDGARGVTAIAALEAREIDSDDIALAEDDAVARNAVDDDRVHGGAEHRGIRRSAALPVAEERRSRLGSRDLALRDSIELGGRRPRDASEFDGFEHAVHDLPRLAHLGDFEGILDDDAHPASLAGKPAAVRGPRAPAHFRVTT